MPSGRTHDRITLLTLPVAGALMFGVSRNPALTLVMCSGFLLGGLMLGPDLDTHSVHYKRWGWFRWIWLPYRGSMKHRSPLSHAPITGTLIRVAYLLVWLSLAGFISAILVNELWQLGLTGVELMDWIGRSLQQHRQVWLALLVGLELGALSHYSADWFVSGCKQYQKKGWRAFMPTAKKSRKSTNRRKPSAKRQTKP